MVDELGGLTEAIEAAKELTGIKGDAHIIEVNPGVVFILSILKTLGIQQELPLSTLPQDLLSIIEFHKTLTKFGDERPST